MTYISIFLPLLLLAIVFLVIVFYRMFYKHNMNKALRGEGTTGMIDLGSFVKTVSIIALLIMNTVLLTRTSEIYYQNMNMQNSLESKIQSVLWKLSSLESQFEEYYDSLELVQDQDYTIVNIDLASSEIEVDINFTLLEKESGASVYLIVYDGETSEKTLLASDSLTFDESIILSKDETYDISVLIEGETTIQESIFTLNTTEIFSSIFTAEIGVLEKSDAFLLMPFVKEELNNVEGVKVSSVTFKIYDMEELKHTETVSSATNVDTLTSGQEDYYIPHNLKGEESIFALLYEDEEMMQVSVELIITLSNGEVVELSLNF